MSVPQKSERELVARRYARLRHVLAFSSLILGLGYLLFMLFWGTLPLMRLASSVFAARYLAIALYALLFFLFYDVAALPISYLEGFWLEKRFGLSDQSLSRWAGTYAKKTVLSLILLIGLTEAVYFCIDRFGNYWWICASLVWFAATVIFGAIFPRLILPLFYRKTELNDPLLLERFRSILDQTGLSIKGVFRIDLSRDTKKVNAALAGWGSMRMVLLADTLLERFSPDEIAAVFAHEVGHYVKAHIPKLIISGAIVATFGFSIASKVLSGLSGRFGFSGASDLAAFPLVCLIITLAGLVMLPFQNFVGRCFERSSDLYALRRTKNPAAFKTAMTKLAYYNLVQFQPNSIIEFLFHSHPSIASRLRLAERYREKYERGVVP